MTGTKLRNIGPKSAAWLRQVGLRTQEDLESVGAVEAFIRVKRAGFRPSLNLLYALEGALLDCHWQQLPEARRGELLVAYDAAAALDSSGPVVRMIRLPAPAAALRPGVVAQAHQLGHLRHLGHQAQVVQVQDAAAVLRGHGKFLGRGVVGGEHDLLAACASLAGQHQLCDGAAIKTAAQLTQQGQDARVGQRLDGVILFEPGHLGKGGVQAGHSGADAGLVVEMKGRAEVLGNGWQLGVQALAKIVGNGHGGFSVCCIY